MNIYEVRLTGRPGANGTRLVYAEDEWQAIVAARPGTGFKVESVTLLTPTKAFLFTVKEAKVV